MFGSNLEPIFEQAHDRHRHPIACNVKRLCDVFRGVLEQHPTFLPVECHSIT
jgi:hypothetical protein